MGILVSEAYLPMGITVSNVYMSFFGEMIYVYPRDADNLYQLKTYYRVYKDQEKNLDTNIRIPINVSISDIRCDIYTILYEKLKSFYPNSVDIIEPEPEVVIPDKVAEIL